MGRYCCVVGCHHTDRKAKIQRPFNKKSVRFHSFPTNPSRRDLWIQALNKTLPDGTLWQPTAWSFVCSDHFEGGVPSFYENDVAYVPTIFPSRPILKPVSSRRSSRQSVNKRSEEFCYADQDDTIGENDENSSNEEEDTVQVETKNFSGFSEKIFKQTEAAHNGFLDYACDTLNIKKPKINVSILSQDLESESIVPSLEINKQIMSVESYNSNNENSKIDLMMNPNLQLPLTQYGWKREIVLKYSESKKCTYEVIYVTPEGTKLDSFSDVAKYLSTRNFPLSLENFNFGRVSIGLGFDVESVVIIQKQTKNEIKKTETEKRPTLSLSDSSKRKTPRTTSKKSHASQNKMNYRNDFSSTTKSSGQIVDNASVATCSILCPRAMGCIPTLQCKSCLCLYHPQCLNLDPQEEYNSYVCSNCSSKPVDEIRRVGISPEKRSENLSPQHERVHLNKSQNANIPKFKFSRKVVPARRNPMNSNQLYLSSTNKAAKVPIPSSPVHPSLHNLPSSIPKDDAIMQSIVQFGGRRFILVPKKNSAIKGVASAPVVTATSQLTNKTSPVSSIMLPSTCSSEGQPFVPNSVTSKSPLGGAYIVTNNQSNVGVLLSVAQGGPNYNTAAQYFVLNNGQMQNILTTPVAANDQAQNKPGPCPVNTLPVSQQSKPLQDLRQSIFPGRDMFSNASDAFNILVKIFSYLQTDDLLRVARVNRLFYAASQHRSLWKTVRLKNCKISDWRAFVDCLNRTSTEILNCNKMLSKYVPDENKTPWASLKNVIHKIPSLRHLDLGRCPKPEISIIEQCAQLTHFVCTFNKKSVLDFLELSKVRNLTCLSIRGLELRKDIGLRILNPMGLVQLKNLTRLSLTSVKQPSDDWTVFLKSMKQLEWLELGECSRFTLNFVNNCLSELKNLKRLRLEMVQENIACDILNTIATFPNLESLELINFDVKQGFEKAFVKCVNVQNLLIIPTYERQSASTVFTMISTLCSMDKTLKKIIWGFTLELLKVTEMLITQYGLAIDSNIHDYVPILPQSYSEIFKLKEAENRSAKKSVEVDVLAIGKLEEMLKERMTETHVRLIKIQYASTVKQFL